MHRWLIAAPASVLCGVVLTWLHMPAAWILGGIIGSGVVALSTGHELPLNKYVFDFARGAIGVLAALPLLGVPPAQFVPFIVPALVLSAAVVALAFAGGIVLSHHGVSRETGILSLLPGGASLMPAISADGCGVCCGRLDVRRWAVRALAEAVQPAIAGDACLHLSTDGGLCSTGLGCRTLAGGDLL